MSQVELVSRLLPSIPELNVILLDIENELRTLLQSKSAALVFVVKLFEYLTDKSQKTKAFLTGKFAKPGQDTT